jgi:hypothetical protein
MKRIELSRRYVGHAPAGTRVALIAEPTGRLYLDLGEPYETQRTSAGERIVIENREAIRGYIEGLVSFEGESDADSVLNQLAVADVRAVKEAVLDFFTAAGTSDGSSTSSPGPQAGDPSPSNP